MAKVYQVGWLVEFTGEDPEYDSLETATNAAVALSLADEEKNVCGHARAAGIWTSQMEGSEIVRIVYMGEVFHREGCVEWPRLE